MPDKIFKAGSQSASDPYEFIMSTASVDRMGDIVEQDWKLTHFKKNPIALWQHNSSEPIGTWRNVRVEGGKLMGRLKLAAEGTSELIDTLRKLIEQRVLRAVSVGFRPGEYEPLDEKDPWGGLRLLKNELLECSLVTVPANAEALSVAKSLCSAETLKTVLAESGALGQELVSAAKQLGEKSRDSDVDTLNINPRPKRKSTMSLADKITAKREILTQKRNALTELTETDVTESDNLEESITHQIQELTGEIKALETDIDTMEDARAALAHKALDRQSATDEAAAGGREAPASKQRSATPARPITAKKNRAPGHNATATIACLVKGFVNRTSPEAVAQSMLKDEPEIVTLIKAATDPATMTDAAWAAPLVRETWSEFLDLIRDMAVYPNLPGMQLEFDRYGKINVPYNNGRGKLAGGFVAEGAPIPVKEGAYAGLDLSPKKMAVISSFTKEVGEHSMPAIQALIQNQMTEDTAEVLDTIYLDAGARDTARPAGIQDTTETGAANIVASTGNTVAAVLADTKAMLGRLLASRSGNGAVWVMNPLRVLGLMDMQDAASGAFVFRDALNRGTFRGYPVLQSQNVTVDVVSLQGNSAMAYGNDYGPRIEVSDETTLVYDDTAPDHVLPDTNVQPAKSMFQMDGVAVKFKQGLDWRQVRANARQVLTGVGW